MQQKYFRKGGFYLNSFGLLTFTEKKFYIFPFVYLTEISLSAMKVSHFAFQRTGNSSELAKKGNQNFSLYNGRQSLDYTLYVYRNV